MHIRRLPHNPIITPAMDARIGTNINGPSLIRVPDWLPDPLGRYYLYFAHHNGKYIRLAYADAVTGPYRVHTPGVLPIETAFFGNHIASPDVRVRHDRRELWLYYHGCCMPTPPSQVTRLAISTDGLNFAARPEVLGVSYWRTWEWDGWHYAIGMPGILYRSRDGLGAFETGPTLFTKDMRHAAVQLRGDTLRVFYSNAFDCPERIVMSTICLRGDWTTWQETPPVTVLTPELDYEGANCPHEASKRGQVNVPAWQLRDPGIYEEGGRAWLLYSVAGEQGLAIAEIVED